MRIGESVLVSLHTVVLCSWTLKILAVFEFTGNNRISVPVISGILLPVHPQLLFGPQKNSCTCHHSLSFLLPDGKMIEWQIVGVLYSLLTVRFLFTCPHGAVVLSVVLKKLPSVCLYTTPAMPQCPLLCPFVRALTVVTLQSCCSKFVGGFSSGHSHWQGSSNRL